MRQIVGQENGHSGGPSPRTTSAQRDPEQLRLERALEESEERFRALSETTNLIALILDTQGNVTFCNQYLLGLIEWRKDEIVGRNWCDICVPWEQYPQMLYRSQLADRAIPSRHQNEIVARSGTRRLIDWHNTSLFDMAGNPAGVASIGREITIDVSLSNLSPEEREVLSPFMIDARVAQRTSYESGSVRQRLRKLKRRRQELNAAIEILEKLACARAPGLAGWLTPKRPN